VCGGFSWDALLIQEGTDSETLKFYVLSVRLMALEVIIALSVVLEGETQISGRNDALDMTRSQ